MENVKKSKQSPKKHHYMLATGIALGIMLIAMIFYFFSSFSSIQKSIAALKKLDNVSDVYYEGDKNHLVVRCENNKEFQVELENTLEYYSPVIADFCR